MYQADKNRDDPSVNERYWYTAETLLGRVYIGIDRTLNAHDQQYPDLLQKAIALIKGEALISHIEDWLNCGLLLQPATIMPTNIYSIAISYRNYRHDNGVGKIILGLHDSALSNLSEPSRKQLEALDIETSSVPIQFVLSEFVIDMDQYRLIDDGRILLIPDSYDEVWRIKLLSLRHTNMCRVGILSSDVRTLVITDLESDDKNSRYCGLRSDQQDDLRPLTVVLRETIPISLDRFLGWKGENTILLNHSLRNYKADVRCESDLVASGQLISVANGYGISISN